MTLSRGYRPQVAPHRNRERSEVDDESSTPGGSLVRQVGVEIADYECMGRSIIAAQPRRDQRNLLTRSSPPPTTRTARITPTQNPALNIPATAAQPVAVMSSMANAQTKA